MTADIWRCLAIAFFVSSMVCQSAVAMAESKSLNGRWRAEDIRRGGVIDRIRTILEINANGAVSGTGGCNRFTGRASIAGKKITFGSVASTRMACTPAVMDQEGKFFAALDDVRAWRIDTTRHKLVLLDGNGNPVIVLARM
jgi:heat shock protein HslJ